MDPITLYSTTWCADCRRKVPTLEIAGRFFACSPFNAEQLAAELGIPLNP